MKYIKEYRIFESNDDLNDIIKNINDILLPIADMGYEPTVTVSDNGYIIIRVVRYNDKPLLIDEFKSDFNTLYQYLDSEDYSVDVKYVDIEDDTGVTTDFYHNFVKCLDMKVSNLLFIANEKDKDI